MSDPHITPEWVDQELERSMTIEGVSHYPIALRALKEALERVNRLLKFIDRFPSMCVDCVDCDCTELPPEHCVSCGEAEALLGESATVQE